MLNKSFKSYVHQLKRKNKNRIMIIMLPGMDSRQCQGMEAQFQSVAQIQDLEVDREEVILVEVILQIHYLVAQ